MVKTNFEIFKNEIIQYSQLFCNVKLMDVINDEYIHLSHVIITVIIIVDHKKQITSTQIVPTWTCERVDCCCPFGRWIAVDRSAV